MTRGIHRRSPAARAALNVLYLFLGALSCWLIYELRIIVICLLMAITLASAIAPVAEWAEAKKIPRVATVVVIFIITALIYSAVAYLLFPPMKEQALALYENLPKYVQGLTTKFPSLNEYIGSDGDQMKIDPEHLKQIAPNVARRTLSLTAGLLGALANMLLVVFLTFYFVVEANSMWEKLLLWVPPQHRERAGSLIKPLGIRMGGYVRGQLLVSIAVATILGTGLTILKVEYSLVLGALAGLFNLVPFVGSAITMVLSLVVAFNQSVELAVLVFLLFALEQWLESNFIVPLLLGKQVDLHPLLVLFAILIGATLMGLPGALVAVPVAAALQLLAQEFYLKPLNAESTANSASANFDAMESKAVNSGEPQTDKPETQPHQTN
ncbi:MAG: AI-2E family transporter [Candidatus Melainabacteria bacterium]|nr:AI-2E family transporter [Candidatus Melainabacteria bacterium]